MPEGKVAESIRKENSQKMFRFQIEAISKIAGIGIVSLVKEEEEEEEEWRRSKCVGRAGSLAKDGRGPRWGGDIERTRRRYPRQNRRAHSARDTGLSPI